MPKAASQAAGGGATACLLREVVSKAVGAGFDLQEKGGCYVASVGSVF